MGHLLMIESWVGSMSRLLPHAIGEAGHRFTFLTRDLHHYLRSAPPGAPHPLLAASNVITTETNDIPALLDHAERLHEVLRFDGVLSSCDYYLPAVAHVADRLGLPGPAPHAVEAACRKDATRRLLADAGVPGPRFAVCGDWDETAAAAARIGFPLVIKPVDLCAGMYVRQVSDEGQLADACAALGGFPVNARGQRRTPVVLLEELLAGPEVSVETVSHDGVCQVVGVTDKSVGGAPSFIETGHMFPAGSPHEREAADTAVAALEALGLDHVVAHTEIKLTDAGPRVVEVNPRPAGNRITELVRHVTGIDLAAAAVDVALGHRPALAPRPTGVRSAAIGFLLPEQPGELAGIAGADDAQCAPGVREVDLAQPGRTVRAATSNNEYLGHVMAVDTEGGGARGRVEAALAGLRPIYVEPAGAEHATAGPAVVSDEARLTTVSDAAEPTTVPDEAGSTTVSGAAGPTTVPGTVEPTTVSAAAAAAAGPVTVTGAVESATVPDAAGTATVPDAPGTATAFNDSTAAAASIGGGA